MNDRATFTHEITTKEINHLYKISNDSGRAGPKDALFGLSCDSELVCATRLLNYNGCWLLRNLCTHPDYRHQGLASQLLQTLQQSGNAPDVIYTLPLPHLNNFYIRNHYQPVADKQVPEPLCQVLRQSRRRHKGILVMASCSSLR